MLCSLFFQNFFETGHLSIIDANGKKHCFGEPKASPAITIRFHHKALHRLLFFNPYLHFGEAYMDGKLTIEEGTLKDFFELVGLNIRNGDRSWQRIWARKIMSIFRSFTLYNSIYSSQQNAAHHYDLSDQLYDLFLDEDRQYSCAYFTNSDLALEEAQDAKKRHLAAKLCLKPGCCVLDIGSGWGGLALYLSQIGAEKVTGITLSEGQYRVSNARAVEAGLAHRVQFHLRDYREETSRYDRIISVGMFEHVGVKQYSDFFLKVRDLLTDDGVALLHSIGRSDGPGTTSQWIRKYIFPGGYSPALSEVIPVIERSGMMITDIEILRLHYAETLKEWSRRFQANRDMAKKLYDERFCRMWEFYLAASEMSFRHWGQFVFQIQIAKRQDTVPLTRDYVEEWEHSHMAVSN